MCFGLHSSTATTMESVLALLLISCRLFLLLWRGSLDYNTMFYKNTLLLYWIIMKKYAFKLWRLKRFQVRDYKRKGTSGEEFDGSFLLFHAATSFNVIRCGSVSYYLSLLFWMSLMISKVYSGNLRELFGIFFVRRKRVQLKKRTLMIMICTPYTLLQNADAWINSFSVDSGENMDTRIVWKLSYINMNIGRVFKKRWVGKFSD